MNKRNGRKKVGFRMKLINYETDGMERIEDPKLKIIMSKYERLKKLIKRIFGDEMNIECNYTDEGVKIERGNIIISVAEATHDYYRMELIYNIFEVTGDDIDYVVEDMFIVDNRVSKNEKI